MDAKDILRKIKAMDLAELPPDTAIEVFAKMLEDLQEVLDGDTLLRFMMIASALYRSSQKSAELQIPGGATLGIGAIEPLGRIL